MSEAGGESVSRDIVIAVGARGDESSDSKVYSPRRAAGSRVTSRKKKHNNSREFASPGDARGGLAKDRKVTTEKKKGNGNFGFSATGSVRVIACRGAD